MDVQGDFVDTLAFLAGIQGSLRITQLPALRAVVSL